MSTNIKDTIELVEGLHTDAVENGGSHATISHLERILPILQAGAKRQVEIEKMVELELSKSSQKIQAEIDKAEGDLKETLKKLNNQEPKVNPPRPPDFTPDFGL